MAIKSNMPRDVYGLCMQYDTLDKLKKFLIELFKNPRMKSVVPSITAATETSAFSMGEYTSAHVTQNFKSRNFILRKASFGHFK